MYGIDRRTFLKRAGLGVAGATTVTWAQSTRTTEANNKLVLGVIGYGSQGPYLAQTFASQKDAVVAYVCDPDTKRATKTAGIVGKAGGQPPKVVEDLRRILDDKTVDAVVVAAPDHWHAPAMILACEAGKHVFVEKPCSHNVREGRLMIEAARRSKRIVQTGMQSRSVRPIIRAMELLHSGAIGQVLVAKVWNSQNRPTIGHAAPTDPPAGFNYDLWVGPAPFVPFQKNRHHYSWHWWYDFGTGDIGNRGVHELDIARWGLGLDTHPCTVAAIGGKYVFDDDQQFPDTQYVVYEYPGDGKIGNKKQIIYEQRTWSPYVQEGHENGNAFYGTKGMLILGKITGWKLFGPKNELIDSMIVEEGSVRVPAHLREFLDAIKENRRPNADIETGHLSAVICHLGSIATRVGRTLQFDPKSEQIKNDKEAAGMLQRTYRQGHWAVPKGA